MQSQEYKLGQEIERKGLRWLVVRIVEKDSALIVSEGEECVSIETYVMLKSASGEIDFEVLLHEVVPYVASSERKIPSLPNLWRKA